MRILVRAAGVNPIDGKTVAGYMREQIPLDLPAGVGSDVAGIVDEIGAGVSEWTIGDEVLGMAETPSFAEYSLADSADLIRKPRDISWEVAGTLAGAAGTGIQVHFDGAGSDLNAALRELVTLVQQRRLTVPMTQTYPLAQVATALSASNTGHINGKIVILP